ncbi:uncharacterized protein [Spinacia oleracea]|uniref:Reverse transcriptase domain-containing protein n=1 Tax=Spinacia oleracea TaxID=3562 RepID=A0ABM3QXF6_SPIOL|nr:uncharacterized protein LOC110804720 [Spinacia oleracea]
MKVVSWNCRGVNNPNSLVRPYATWLVKTYLPMFLFVSETKSTVANVSSLLGGCNPTCIFGIDSVGSSGGLVVFGWTSFEVSCLFVSSNIVLCRVIEPNGNIWEVMFVYGAPKVEDREEVWNQILTLLMTSPTCLLIGDFNQIELYSDKLGGSSVIKGWDLFLQWRLASNLSEVPFSGPPFTWTNKRESTSLIMERLDRGYMTDSWFIKFPNTRIINQPILISDHAAIILQTEEPIILRNRPYQLENWCFSFPEVKSSIQEVWNLHIWGSPMFTLSRKMDTIRKVLRKWCLGNKKLWGINWHQFTGKLALEGLEVDNLQKGNNYNTLIQQSDEQAKLCYQYWSRRMKELWVKSGDCPSKLLFSKVRKRQKRNEVLRLKDRQGTFREGQDNVQQLVVDNLKMVFKSDASEIDYEEVDYVLCEMDLPQLSPNDISRFTTPFSIAEITKAMFDMNGSKSPGPDGMSVEFFKKHWQIVGNSVIKGIQSFFRTGFLLKEWNHSLLVMIPKIASPEEVLINGRTSQPFRPKCGLRQGDPLSPYLFLFCMDILGRMLSLGQDIKLFQGIKLAREAPKISHLFFADEAMVFFRATENSCTNIGGIIDRYCRISGQQLNLAKSFIKFSPNTPIPQQQLFKSILRMPQVTQFGQHLGVPIDCMGSKRSHFNYLIDKVADLITSWNGVLISQVQKMVLINTVIVATVSHVMMSLDIPITILNKIDSMIATFFWAKQGYKGMHWIRKSILHLPRGMGGLGIRNLSTLNKAFLMKQVWRMHQNPQLLISKVYAAKGKFALSIGKANGCEGHISWGMRGLRRAENLLLQGCAWKVGDGRHIRVGKDNWVHGKVPVFASHIRLTDARLWTVSHFIQSSEIRWDAALVRRSFDNCDANAILSVELPSESIPDRLYWPKNTVGNFTVKTGYAFLQEQNIGQDPNLGFRHNNRLVPFFKLLWALKILPKWKLFIWKIMVDGIPVKVNLERRGIMLDVNCDLCSDHCEDAQHTFRLCKLAQDLFISEDGKLSDRVVTFIGTLWALWVTRNSRVFRSETGNIQTVQTQFILALQQNAIYRKKNDENMGYLHPPEHMPTYPPEFYFANIGREIANMSGSVIYIDGAWNKVTSRAGMGWVLELPQTVDVGIVGGCDYGLGHSALHAESMACLQALRWATNSSVTDIAIHTDSATLVSFLLGKDKSNIRVRWTVNAIFNIGKSFRSCAIYKVDRGNIQSAHDLASRASKEGLQFSTPFAVRPNG